MTATMMYTTFLQGQRYTVRVVDRIGGGDSFATGLIHGFVSGCDLEATPQGAVAASALKQTIPGDFNQVSVARVGRFVAGDASGRVQGQRWRPWAACLVEEESS